MTSQALEPGMSAGQRELRLIVIEGRRFPRSCAVAIGAKVVKVVGHVIRISDRREVRGMTAEAGLIGSGISLQMTRNALQRGVRADQDETGRSVIPVGGRPSGSRMATRAVVRECGLDVIGISS